MIDFTMPGHLAPVPQTWKQGRVQSSPLNRSKGRIVMKTSCASCAHRARVTASGSYGSRATPGPREARWRLSGLVRCPFPRRMSEANDEPRAALERRRRTGPGSFIRRSYNATRGASKAMRRGNFHRWDTNETLAVRLNRKTLKHQIIYMQPTPLARPYERTGRARKRTSAEGVRCAGLPPKQICSPAFDAPAF